MGKKISIVCLSLLLDNTVVAGVVLTQYTDMGFNHPWKRLPFITVLHCLVFMTVKSWA